MMIEIKIPETSHQIPEKSGRISIDKEIFWKLKYEIREITSMIRAIIRNRS